MNSTRVVPSGSSSFLIRIDEASSGDIKGVVDGAALKTPLTFSSFTNLAFMLDDALDQLDALSAFDEFSIRKVAEDFNPNLELEILFRQNHSWQGKVCLLDQQKEATFRSVLELLIFLCTIYES